jgi:hypothetical protein
MHAIRGLSSRQVVRWQPVLEGRPRVARAGFFIAGIIEEALRRVDRAPGLDGHAGWAVGFAYFARGHDPRFAEPAAACLAGAADHLTGMVLPARLGDGYPGVAWAAEHVHAVLGLEDDEIADAIRDVDDDVAAWLAAWTPAMAPGLDGLAGLAIYLVERAVRAPDTARAGLAQLGRALAGAALERVDGATWRVAGEPLELAAGVPGIVTALAAVADAGLAPPSARALVAGAVDWLRGQYHGEAGRPGRGDLAVATALLRAGQAFERADWVAEAVALAGLVAARPADEARGVGLAAGSAGRGLVFQRFHHATGERRFAAAAARAYELTLERGCPEGDDSLATGSLGVALALSAAITAIEPRWDRALGLS